MIEEITVIKASLKLRVSPLRIGGWETILSFWVLGHFQGLLLLVWGRVTVLILNVDLPFFLATSKIPFWKDYTFFLSFSSFNWQNDFCGVFTTNFATGVSYGIALCNWAWFQEPYVPSSANHPEPPIRAFQPMVFGDDFLFKARSWNLEICADDGVGAHSRWTKTSFYRRQRYRLKFLRWRFETIYS